MTSNNVFAEYIGVLSILSVNGESIVKGYSGSTPPPFKPGNQISRGQMAKIIDLARQWYPDPWTKAFSELENSYANVQRDGVVHDWCVFKVVDYSSIGDYGDSIAFYNSNHDNAYLVTGEIWEHYYSNGGCNEFGLPTGNMWSPDTPCGTNGTSQYFEGWQVFYSRHRTVGIDTTTELWGEFNTRGNLETLGYPVETFEDGIEDELNERFPDVDTQVIEPDGDWIDGAIFERGIIGIDEDGLNDNDVLLGWDNTGCTDNVILDVPIIREDVCDYSHYEGVTLFNNSSCGNLCGDGSVAGCHIIAAAMVYSFYENNKLPTDLVHFNNSLQHTGCDIVWNSRLSGSGIPNIDFGGIVDLYSNNHDQRFKYHSQNFNINFFEYEDRIRKSLDYGMPVILQLEYGLEGGSSTMHAFPIVGYSEGKYLINDEFYPQAVSNPVHPGGVRFTTLDDTISTIFDIRSNTDYVRMNMVVFYEDQTVNTPFYDGSSPNIVLY